MLSHHINLPPKCQLNNINNWTTDTNPCNKYKKSINRSSSSLRTLKSRTTSLLHLNPINILVQPSLLHAKQKRRRWYSCRITVAWDCKRRVSWYRPDPCLRKGSKSSFVTDYRLVFERAQSRDMIDFYFVLVNKEVC